jgi:hypothetical protein
MQTEDLQQELAGLKIDPSNPYMQCLANLLVPPTNLYAMNLTQYYEGLLSTATGKKKEVIENLLNDLKKKYKQTGI